MISVAICDNNLQFCRLLTRKLRDISVSTLPDRYDCTFAPEFCSANELLEYVKHHSIDILFLDIDMPEMSGFELAGVLKDRYPDIIIIFVSAYDGYVYSSFKFNPFRFLRKSKLEKELPEAFTKAIEKCAEDEETICFHSIDGDVYLRAKNILYLESDRNYFVVFCVSGEQYKCRGTLTSVEKELAGLGFFRIHAAYIINEEHIKTVQNNNAVLMNDGKYINVSRSKSAYFKEWYSGVLRRKLTR